MRKYFSKNQIIIYLKITMHQNVLRLMYRYL